MAYQASHADCCQVSADQLCIGLFVYLDLPWSAHPFGFSSFKIKSSDQLQQLRALGLPAFRVSRSRSDCLPPAADTAVVTELPDGVPAASPIVVPTPAAAAPLSHIDRVHRRMADCERQFTAALRRVRGVYRDVLDRPEAACEGVIQMIDEVAGAMLADADVSLQLMSDLADHEPPYDHGLNVAVMSMLLARELKVSSQDMRWIGAGALLHDIGLQELPARIVRKSEPLTQTESRLLKEHCRLGADLGRRMKLPPTILQIIAHHHERIDGSGYPDHLQGPALSLPVRIVAVVNAYDELCNPTHGAAVRNPHEALSLIYGQQRATFDPMMLAGFVRCMGVYPPGTLVQLSDGGHGVVLAVNSDRPLKPLVLKHDPLDAHAEPVLVDLDRAADLMVSKTLLPSQLDAAVWDALRPRRRIACYVSVAESVLA